MARRESPKWCLDIVDFELPRPLDLNLVLGIVCKTICTVLVCVRARVCGGVLITTGGTMYNDLVRYLGDAVHKMQQHKGHTPKLIGFANLNDIVHRDTIQHQARGIDTPVRRLFINYCTVVVIIGEQATECLAIKSSDIEWVATSMSNSNCSDNIFLNLITWGHLRWDQSQVRQRESSY